MRSSRARSSSAAGSHSGKTIASQLLDRLAMSGSVPGRDFAVPGTVPRDLFDESYFEHYRRLLENLAVPYRVDKRLNHASRTDVPVEGINAATGLVSTVRDLAQFDLALDGGILLREDTLAAAWTAASSAAGRAAAVRARLVRPELSRRASGLAVWPGRQWVFGDDREDPITTSDDDPAGQQRWSRELVPARGRRRHPLALRVGAAANAAVNRGARTLSASWSSRRLFSFRPPRRRAPSGSSPRSSATPSERPPPF